MLGRTSLIGLPGHTDSGMHTPGSEVTVAWEVPSAPAERGNSNSAKGGGSGGSGGGDGRTKLDVIYNPEEENYETVHLKMS